VKVNLLNSVVYTMNLGQYYLALQSLVFLSSTTTNGFTFLTSVKKQSTFANNHGAALNKNTHLFGILDEINSDAFDLSGSAQEDGPSQSALEQAYEMFLAELVFSPNDPRVDILDNSERSFDPNFLDFLKNKFETTNDVEEKIALQDLHGMILDVQEKIELSEQTRLREEQEKVEAEKARIAALEKEAEEGRGLSDTDVLKRAAAVDEAGVKKELGLDYSVDSTDEIGTSGEKKTFYETELTPEIRQSYEKFLKKILPPYAKPNMTPAIIVENNYDSFDAQLIKVLNERATNGDQDSQDVLDALARAQENRVLEATEKLKQILSAGDPQRMEGVIVKLAREAKIDEPLLLLLEANADQAEAAGAVEPAALMRKLKERAIQEKDKASASKEIKLLRQLIRTADKDTRDKLLEDAFTPREALIVPGTMENAAKVADGEIPDEDKKPMPDVSPPDFINACKAVLINFGNIGSGDNENLTEQIKTIAAEAEVVATRIFGKGMSPREQQDRMWKDCTTSIFDLERMEIEAERMGEQAPWSRDASEEILPGFDADGRMKIGGM